MAMMIYDGVGCVPRGPLAFACELTGGNELLAPLLLALAVAGLALQSLPRRPLYEAQSNARGRRAARPSMRPLRQISVRSVMETNAYASVRPSTLALAMQRLAAEVPHQRLFPVLDPFGRMIGVVTVSAIRALEGPAARTLVAGDVMQWPVWIRADDDLSRAAKLLRVHRLVEMPVVDRDDRIIGSIGERRVAEILQCESPAR